MFSDVIIGQ